MSDPLDDSGPADWDSYFAGSADKERCGGTGMVSTWDGGGYVGEGCPGCVDCDAPDEAIDSLEGPAGGARGGQVVPPRSTGATCDESCESELTSHGYTECRCSERAKGKS